jgi:hypothetical protein
MFEEGLVLGRGEGVDQELRIFLEGELDAAFAGEGLHGVAVRVVARSWAAPAGS